MATRIAAILLTASVWLVQHSAAASTVGEIKAAPDGAAGQVRGAYVSAAFDGFFYIQDIPAASGLRVECSSATVTRGCFVGFDGTLSTNLDNERVLIAPQIASDGWGEVRPLAIRCSEAGGQDWMRTGGGSGQIGIEGGRGLNNIGLLVVVSGWVSESGDGFFYVHDGSAADDGSGYLGLKAVSALVPPKGSFVSVTGVVSCETLGGKVRPVLLVATADDITFVGNYVGGSTLRLEGHTSSYVLASPHPTTDDQTLTWEGSAPAGTVRLRLFFTKLELDALDAFYVMNSSGDVVQEYNYFNNTYPKVNFWGPWIEGSGFRLGLLTSFSYFLNGRYGFSTSLMETASFAAISGVTLTLQPGNRSVVTGADGSYSFGALPSGSYTITPSKAGYTFSPPSYDLAVGEGDVVNYVDFSGEP